MRKDYEKIAKRAIERAKKDLEKETITLDASDDINSHGITGYMARQIDGEAVDGRTSAEVEISCAKQEIFKAGRNKKAKTIDDEAMKAIQILNDFEEEFLPEE